MKSRLFAILCLLVAACSGDESATGTKTILVTGATGTQGGAVARELLARGYDVRGLTRNPDSASAQALAGLGVTMVRGDYEDVDGLVAAMDDVYGVFAMTNFWEHGYDNEVRHGRNLVDAATRARVRHFIYSSNAAADRGTGIPHFESKAEIEAYLKASDLIYTVVRPVEFMDNIRWDRERILDGYYVDPRDPNSSHQWIAVRDVGFFVGEAFDNPGEWQGRTLEIAGDEMTVGEYIALVSRIAGVDIEYRRQSWEEFRDELGEEMTEMFQWFEASGYDAEVATLRDRYPDLLTQEEFLASLDWLADN